MPTNQSLSAREVAASAGVAGVDDLGHVRAFEQALEHLQTSFVFLDWHQIKVIRQHRKIFEVPLPALYFRAFGRNHFNKMPYGRRDHVLIVLEEIFLALELAKRACEIACDAGLLRNDERFGHLKVQPKLSLALIANGKGKTRTSLAQFHKVFPGQLLDQSL